jgi:hypothetical protein
MAAAPNPVGGLPVPVAENAAGHFHRDMGLDVNRRACVCRACGHSLQDEEIGVSMLFPLCRTDCRWDDLFLGIGAVILLQTYIVGTILYGWVEQMYAALNEGNYVWLLDNDVRIVRFWYSTSATYIFSIVSRFRFCVLTCF